MNTRPSDDDKLENYMADLPTILREADPAYAAAKLRAALDNPELDAALTEARRAPALKPTPTARQPRTTAKPGKIALPRWLVYVWCVAALVIPAVLVVSFMKPSPPSPIGSGSERAGAHPIAPADAGADTGANTDAHTDAGTLPAIDTAPPTVPRSPARPDTTRRPTKLTPPTVTTPAAPTPQPSAQPTAPPDDTELVP